MVSLDDLRGIHGRPPEPSGNCVDLAAPLQNPCELPKTHQGAYGIVILLSVSAPKVPRHTSKGPFGGLSSALNTASRTRDNTETSKYLHDKHRESV